MRIPNIPHDSVPVGESEDDNVEIRKWGEQVPAFEFRGEGALGRCGRSENILILNVRARLQAARFAFYLGLRARLRTCTNKLYD